MKLKGEGGGRRPPLQDVMGYGPSDYDFPRLYVEGVEPRGRREYLVPDLDSGTYRLAQEPPPGARALALSVYDEAWSLVLDPVEARATRAFAVTLPWRGWEALFVEAGTRVYLVEVHGVQSSLAVREGDEVGERSIIAHVVTGKGETRTVRAGVEGIVVLVAWEWGSLPPRYAVAVAPRGSVLRLRRAE